MNIKDRISSIKSSSYYKSANLHIHSTYSDGKCSFESLVDQGKLLKLEHMSIVDHNSVEGWRNFNTKDYNFLITGVEFDCFYKGTLLHILGYGIDPFKSRHPKKVIDAIHNAGGIAVFAHPCCCWVINLDAYTKSLKNLGLDGIEVYYPYKRHRGIIKFHSRKKIKDLAIKHNLVMTGGTDEHGSLIKQYES